MLLQLAGGTAPGAGTAAAPLTPLVSSNHARSWQGVQADVFALERSGFGGGGLCYCFSFFLFVLSLCCGLWVCLVWVCWRVFCFKGGGAGPTSRVNYLSPALHVFTGGLPKTTQDPLASSRAAWGQQQEAPSSSRVLQLPQSPCCSWCGQPCPCVTSAQGSSSKCWGCLVSVLCPSWSKVGPRSASTAALLPVCASACTPGPAPPRCLCEGPRSEGKYFPQRAELFG